MSEVVAIILCAGASSRMGTPKALLPWGASTVLEHILLQLKRSGLERILIVTGAHNVEIRSQLPDLAFLCHHNQKWETGMGSSIASGIRESQRRFHDAQGYLLLLGDQPMVDKAYLRSMLDTFHEKPDRIVATQYPEGGGVPAIFPFGYSSVLKSLSGKQGASSLLRDQQVPIRLLAASNAGKDMDTPEDYERLLRLWKAQEQGNTNQTH